LTQNTSWKNAESALRRLKGKAVDELLDHGSLGDLIKSAGFYVQKERYLRAFLRYYGSKIENLSLPADARNELLDLKGIGRETADSVALYALHQRTVPVDSYTLRLFNRYFGTDYSMTDYEEIRASLIAVFNQEQLMEFHALIDEHCKEVCKKSPRCYSCSISKNCLRNY
jgi:endonuclease-3 related protein